MPYQPCEPSWPFLVKSASYVVFGVVILILIFA
jgi:hypothetical protein